MNKKLLKASTTAAINKASTSNPLKDHVAPVKEVKKSEVAPQMSVTELSSLLSLDEAEEVSSHPILKFVDFSVPLEKLIFIFVSSPRFASVTSFPMDVPFIRANLATLTGPAVLEAARLLADSELASSMCVTPESERENLQRTSSLFVGIYRERFKSTRLPPSMAVAINILLGCVIDPTRTVAEISVNDMKQMIFRAEVHHNVACTALDIDQWDKFKSIMNSCPLSPHYSPILVFHITSFILRN
ncbi:hypothetical protein OSTOST_16717, partial [Ostertagia ostertagi]